jgi:hypothetical protein
MVVLCSALASLSSAIADGLRRRSPDEDLAYHVQATIVRGYDSGGGAGFFLKTDTDTFFVTAAHVLFDPESRPALRGSEVLLVSWPKDRCEVGQNKFSVGLVVAHARGDLRKHPTQDVAVIRLGTRATAVVSTTKSGIVSVDAEDTLVLANVLVANGLREESVDAVLSLVGHVPQRSGTPPPGSP